MGLLCWGSRDSDDDDDDDGYLKTHFSGATLSVLADKGLENGVRFGYVDFTS